MVENNATNGLTLAPDPIGVLGTSAPADMPANNMPEQHPAQ
ncbi:hypothetical protein [Halomonas ventosae]|uniref:Uncharacterized protein n=1 Tax=Halomonas ventosae TaxID=229007 RepID=A0A2T0VS42_9GAMM|nr:hypothetical protein [Halomonas ventosae]PRY73415.1 hypothetical protein BCL64_10178 [Halomonas ventosae]